MMSFYRANLPVSLLSPSDSLKKLLQFFTFSCESLQGFFLMRAFSAPHRYLFLLYVLPVMSTYFSGAAHALSCKGAETSTSKMNNYFYDILLAFHLTVCGGCKISFLFYCTWVPNKYNPVYWIGLYHLINDSYICNPLLLMFNEKNIEEVLQQLCNII